MFISNWPEKAEKEGRQKKKAEKCSFLEEKKRRKKGKKCPPITGAVSPRWIRSAKSHYSGLQRTGPEKAAVIKSL